MIKDDILRMAREAGFRTGSYALSNGDECVFAHAVAFSDCIPELERFAALVAAAEREDCAKLCDAIQKKHEDEGTWLWEAKNCAAAIRARGQQ